METMPFGRYKNSIISEIPTDYLRWGCRDLKGGIQRQFADELARRGGQAPKPRTPEILGHHDCSRYFNPLSDWPGREEWNGISPPWEPQIDELSAEFRAIIG